MHTQGGGGLWIPSGSWSSLWYTSHMFIFLTYYFFISFFTHYLCVYELLINYYCCSQVRSMSSWHGKACKKVWLFWNMDLVKRASVIIPSAVVIMFQFHLMQHCRLLLSYFLWRWNYFFLRLSSRKEKDMSVQIRELLSNVNHHPFIHAIIWFSALFFNRFISWVWCDFSSFCIFVVKLTGKLQDGTVFFSKGHGDDDQAEPFEFKTNESNENFPNASPSHINFFLYQLKSMFVYYFGQSKW